MSCVDFFPNAYLARTKISLFAIFCMRKAKPHMSPLSIHRKDLELFRVQCFGHGDQAVQVFGLESSYAKFCSASHGLVCTVALFGPRRQGCVAADLKGCLVFAWHCYQNDRVPMTTASWLESWLVRQLWWHHCQVWRGVSSFVHSTYRNLRLRDCRWISPGHPIASVGLRRNRW